MDFEDDFNEEDEEELAALEEAEAEEEAEEEEEDDEEDGEEGESAEEKAEKKSRKEKRAQEAIAELSASLKRVSRTARVLKEGINRLSPVPIFPDAQSTNPTSKIKFPIKTPEELKALADAKQLNARNVNRLHKTASKSEEHKKQATKLKTDIIVQMKEIKNLVKMYNAAYLAELGRWVAKVISEIGSAVAAAFPYILIGLAVILLVGILFVSVVAIAQNGLESVAGVNGEKFYGVRLIYEDKESEKTQIIKDYGTIVYSSIKTLEDNHSDIELDITLEIAEDYDYENIETDSAMAEELALIKEIAKIVYNKDTGETAPEDLTTLANGIKYFGINEELHADISAKIWEYLSSTPYYTVKDGETLDETVAQEEITNTVASFAIRTEKLFIEDQLFKQDSDTLTISTERVYKYMIYLPKQNVTIDWLYIKAYKVNTEEFKMFYQNGTEQPVELTLEGGEEEQYFYYSNQNLGIIVPPVEDPSTGEDLKGSLANITKLADYQKYLTLAKDEDGNDIENVYTYLNSGFMLKFESSISFMFCEMEVTHS